MNSSEALPSDKKDKKAKKKKDKEDRYAGLSKEEKKKLKAERKKAREQKREKRRVKQAQKELEQQQPAGPFDFDGKLKRNRELTKILEGADDEETGSIMPRKRPVVAMDQEPQMDVIAEGSDGENRIEKGQRTAGGGDSEGLEQDKIEKGGDIGSGEKEKRKKQTLTDLLNTP